MNVVAGNGTFTTAAAAANTGTASIGPGTVTSPSEWQAASGTYTISFTSPTAYQVTNSSGTVLTKGTYDGTTGDTVAFNGIQVALSGDPATGDQFTVARGQLERLRHHPGPDHHPQFDGPQFRPVATQISQAIEQLSSTVNT